MVLSQGDDSAIHVAAVFMFIPGMPVVVKQNILQGLMVVNGAAYAALGVILDNAHPGHCVSADTILPLRSAGRHLARAQDDKEPSLCGHAAKYHPLNPYQHKNRITATASSTSSVRSNLPLVFRRLHTFNLSGIGLKLATRTTKAVELAIKPLHQAKRVQRGSLISEI